MTVVRWIVLTSLFLSGLLLQSRIAFAEVTEKRNQLEELFIWKLSDELKLSSLEEKKFTEIVKDLNHKKADYNHRLQQSVEKMSKLSSTKKREEELTQYRTDLQIYNRISEEEFDRVKSLLGTDRTVQYIQIKQDLTNRIKSMLANPESSAKSDKKVLPPPKVIEEK